MSFSGLAMWKTILEVNFSAICIEETPGKPSINDGFSTQLDEFASAETGFQLFSSDDGLFYHDRLWLVRSPPEMIDPFDAESWS